MKNKLVVIISALLLNSIFIHPVWASSIGLAIDPPLLRVQIKPGKSITKSFFLQNTGTADKTVVIRVIPFNKSDKEGNPEINLKNQAAWQSYFNLSNTNIKLNEPFNLKADTKEQIILSISIPETANLEDLYANLLVSTYDNTLPNEQKGTQVSATIGANLLITITSEVDPKTITKIEKIYITSGNFLKIGRRFFIDNLSPFTIGAIATNNGNFLSEVKGTFKITRPNSEVVSVQGLQPVFLIAKSSRNLYNSDGKLFIYTPNLNQIGTYNAQINIKTENTNSTNSIEIIFLPIKASLALIISLLTLKTIVSLTKKKS